MYLLNLSSALVSSSNSLEELTQFLWDDFFKVWDKKSEVEEVYDSEYDTKEAYRKPRAHKCIKLSDEQRLSLNDWYQAVSLGGSRTIMEMDLTTEGEFVEVGLTTFQSAEFYKITDLKGQKVVFHHWHEGKKASKRLRNAWRWADVIVCCHSATLPSEYQHKAAVYSGGKVTLHKSVVFSGPYADNR